MNKMNFVLILLAIMLLSTSCSTFNKMAVSGSSGLIYSSSNGILAVPNFENFKNGVSGNLLMIEGLLKSSPNNLNLLATLNKGYAGYAFAVNETQMLEEEWGGQKIEMGRQQALLNYTHSLDYGKRYLDERGIHLNEVMVNMHDSREITQHFEKQLNSNIRDSEVVLFTAQALGALINLQKDNMKMISLLPLVKGMFDWVCEKNPEINFGTCDIFYGAYEAGRPKMLGGNPEKGKEIFQRAIAKYPHNWLILASFMQFYLIPQNDEDGFKEQMRAMESMAINFNAVYVFDNQEEKNNDWMQEENLRFYQALALKRYELMKRFKKQFF